MSKYFTNRDVLQVGTLVRFNAELTRKEYESTSIWWSYKPFVEEHEANKYVCEVLSQFFHGIVPGNVMIFIHGYKGQYGEIQSWEAKRLIKIADPPKVRT